MFFVDELDRCNPRFAVLVLERIKHQIDLHLDFLCARSFYNGNTPYCRE
ncbi:hypothetical protein [Porphyromonas gingivalis]